jgi:FAD-dependent oxidoreductase domain-containing protein 1
VQRAHGANTAVLSPEEIVQRFPWIRTDGVAGAGFGLTGEGTFDGPALMQAFRRKAIALGARYVTGERRRDRA